MRNISKSIFVVVAILAVLMLLFRGAYIVGSKNEGKKIYMIEVNTYPQSEIFTTNSYTVDSSNCIHFKDIMGFQKVVCNHYTITEF